ncbi:MAG: xanthine dehydrogenase family protein molybdopterin-binding subunit [Gammaproteobacteria bacterium]|nr:xanthine dehydrogenase family protein molybdopterin-binding subunit [Gammaproteobacteria bacterium]
MTSLSYAGISELAEAVNGQRLHNSALDEFRVVKLDRRQFLKLTGVVGGGLMLASVAPRAHAQDSATFQPNGYLKIDSDGIQIFAKNPEIGQGVKTSLPMIVAEELDASWSDVQVLQAPIDTGTYGYQFAGGSMSIPTNYATLRNAGATARSLLIRAAANKWNVDKATLATQNSHVVDSASGRKLSYVELAGDAASLPMPSDGEVALKDPKQFRLLGTRLTGVDNEAIVKGEPLFGIDQSLPGLKYAVYQKCPAIGGTVSSANLADVKKMPGIVDAFVLEGNGNASELLPGVAIVANSTWEAMQAKKALRVEWDESDASKDNWEQASNEADRLRLENGQQQVVNQGDVDAALESSAGSASGFYKYHFVSHAPLEPQNCTASFKDGALVLWAPTQTPPQAIGSAARIVGVAPNKVTLNQMRCGGGFGRRLYNDFVCEAAAIAKHVGVPIKLQWTREDDIAYDLFRAGGFHQMDGSVDADGKITGWRDRFITFTADGNRPVTGGSLDASVFPNGLVPNMRVEQTSLKWTNRCAAWRAPGSNVFAFVVQSFLHELADAANRDHLEVLLEVLGEPRRLGRMHTGRASGVVKLAAEKAGWGRELPKGHGLGVAFYFSHQGYVAQVAEVGVGDPEGARQNRSGESVQQRKLYVHKITTATDVGPIVNLSGAENQVQGSVIDGLSTMMDLSVTFENGRVQETNFDRYRMLRMPSTPQVAVHFIDTGEFPPTGLGEPAFPPVAPAVCNAIFAASGHRVRTMPISEEGFYLA